MSTSDSYHYIIYPTVFMREAPSFRSEVASQARFSEKISILEQKSHWFLIMSPDGYQGWIPKASFIQRDSIYPTSAKTSRLAANLYRKMDVKEGPFLILPYHSELHIIETPHPRWAKVALPDGRKGFIQTGDLTPEPKLSHKKDLATLSLRFLGLPYTWGGRSSFGYDCSGFTQMLYRQIGCQLPRNSYQQVLDPHFREVSIQELEPGDLIFFGSSAQQIVHVGMYLGDGAFIHATTRECQPWIRISKLSDPEWNGQPEAPLPFRTFRQLIAQAS